MVDTKRKNRGGDPDAGSAKRQRVSRACDQCRAAREKCDGIQPICFTCASSNRACTYTTNPKRRGIQPGYIRTLELTLAWTLNNVSGAEQALTRLLHDEKGQLLISGSDTAVANKLHKNWRKHVISKAIDRVLSGESIDDLFEKATSPSDDEEDEDEAPQQVTVQGSLLTPDSLRAGYTHFQTDDTAEPQFQDMQPQPSIVPFDAPQPASGKVKLPTNHWRCIDVYFAYTHSWLPLTSKERILKLCYSYPSEGLELSPGRHTADHAELWSILALASIQDGCNQQDFAVGSEDILAVAEHLAYSVMEDVEIGHVSALLNLALINVALQRSQLAYLLLGRAIRTGLYLDLGLAANNERPVAAAERLHGLILGCFVVETMVAGQLGATPSLRTDVIKKLGLIPEEGLDEWQPWSGCDGFSNKQRIRPTLPSQAKSTFNQLLKLCHILNDRIIEKKLDQTTTASASSLSSWLTTLPASLGPLHSMSPEQSSPQKLHLFLAFLVGRSFDSENRQTIEEALSVFDHFTYALGLAAMPPLFACFLDILKEKSQNDGFQHNRLAGILTRFSTVWTERKDGVDIAIPSSVQSLSTPVQNDLTPRASAMGIANIDTFSSPQASSPHLQRRDTMQLPTPSSTILQQPPSAGLGSMQNTAGLGLTNSSVMGGGLQPSRSYSADASMDLDALFDHFTSVDGAEQTGVPDQFMQNLGFAPDVNLADLMTNDFGWGFNPG